MGHYDTCEPTGFTKAPALLFYKLEDWQNRETHCFDRFGALALHFQVAQEYGQDIAMSDALESLMHKFFPSLDNSILCFLWLTYILMLKRTV